MCSSCIISLRKSEQRRILIVLTSAGYSRVLFFKLTLTWQLTISISCRLFCGKRQAMFTYSIRTRVGHEVRPSSYLDNGYMIIKSTKIKFNAVMLGGNEISHYDVSRNYTKHKHLINFNGGFLVLVLGLSSLLNSSLYFVNLTVEINGGFCFVLPFQCSLF